MNTMAPGVTIVTCQTLPCVFGAGGLLLESEEKVVSFLLFAYLGREAAGTWDTVQHQLETSAMPEIPERSTCQS